VYAFGEPGCGAHQRMKAARWLLGRFPSPTFRRPVRPLSADDLGRIRQGLEAIGLTCAVSPEAAPTVDQPRRRRSQAVPA
jgi:hypothetical protein